MKENTKTVQNKVLGRLIDSAKVLLIITAVFSLPFIMTACNSTPKLDAQENKKTKKTDGFDPAEVCALVDNSSFVTLLEAHYTKKRHPQKI